MNYTVVYFYKVGRQVTCFNLEEGDYFPGSINICVIETPILGDLEKIYCFWPNGECEESYCKGEGFNHPDDVTHILNQMLTKYLKNN